MFGVDVIVKRRTMHRLVSGPLLKEEKTTVINACFHTLRYVLLYLEGRTVTVWLVSTVNS